ncbi:MAG: DNA mismatch repair endonuclease MutL, partial [Eubacterium sp.]|nr:DNA mismatch repair endonuclease MutL [Eubacterium sp.]
MPRINVLPKEVYSLIAAGEVVERPMSIVKEMIENSIDAGAKHITVEIKNGGTTYIRITDDGCGIAGEDVKKVFISHATSKISTGADLGSIATLGFRGEAMASIAAVAKVELLTKSEEEEMGTRYEIAGGEELDFSDAGCPQGTTVVVRDIFFNVPARMKFLKKDVTEGNSVQGIVERIAISNPDISFRFIREGRQVMITAGNGDLKSTIYSVYGAELSETLVPVEYSYGGMKLTGYASRPHQSRKSRAMQFFFINGRLVDSRLAKAALEQAYKNLIMVGRFPACVLNIEMDTKLVDVNVHPAKIEVRFVNEKPIFDLIYYGVKTAVEQQDTVKEGKLNDNSISSIYGEQIKTHSSKIDFFKKEEKPNQLKFSSASPKTWSVASPKIPITREPVEEETKKEVVFEKPNIEEKTEIIPRAENRVEAQPIEETVTPVIVDEKDDVPVFKVV